MTTMTAEKPANKRNHPSTDRAEWERQVVANLVYLLDCSTQKATDIANSQMFVLNQAWAKGFCAKSTATAVELSASPL